MSVTATSAGTVRVCAPKKWITAPANAICKPGECKAAFREIKLRPLETCSQALGYFEYKGKCYSRTDVISGDPAAVNRALKCAEPV